MTVIHHVISIEDIIIKDIVAAAAVDDTANIVAPISKILVNLGLKSFFFLCQVVVVVIIININTVVAVALTNCCYSSSRK